MTEQLKGCLDCSEDKPLTSFFPSKCTPDGLAYRCKPCSISAWKKQSAERDARLATFAKPNLKPKARKRPAQPVNATGGA